MQQTLDPTENLKILHDRYPDANITLYHGNDFEIVPAEQFLNEIGGKIEIFPYYDRLSPPNILEALNNRITFSKQNRNLISTKANTLVSLKDRLKRSKIEDIYICTVSEFEIA